MSMSRPQPRTTFVVPQPVPGTAAAAKKPAREPTPLAMVPESLVDEDLEPQWVEAIETATD